MELLIFFAILFGGYIAFLVYKLHKAPEMDDENEQHMEDYQGKRYDQYVGEAKCGFYAMIAMVILLIVAIVYLIFK